MTTSTHSFGWNGISDPQKAAQENDRIVKRVNRVLTKVGQPAVSNVGDSSLEIIYDIDKNKNVSYVVSELRECKMLGYSINETIARLQTELKN